jgi:hypothetical protein
LRIVSPADKDKILALVCGYVIADGGLVKRFMSRRAIVPGGVMMSKNSSAKSVELLLNELTGTLSGTTIYTEFRNYYDYSVLKEVFEQCGYSYKAHLNFQVQTPSVEHCLKQLSTTKRRDVKLSLKQGAAVVDSEDILEVTEFYEILSDLYKYRIITPLFSKDFFLLIVNQKDCHLCV